jgi:hypothetical protein
MALQSLSERRRSNSKDEYLVFKDTAGHRLAVDVNALKYGTALQAVSQTGDVDGCVNFMIPQSPRIRETFPFEVWEKSQKRHGSLRHVRNRTRREVAEAVQRWLQLAGYDKWTKRIKAKPAANKEIESLDDIIVSRLGGRNEIEKVVVAVVKYRKWQEEASYHEVLRVEVHEKRIADEIVAGLSDFLVARTP